MILDGKVTAAALEKDIRERIDVLKERGCTLKLAVILAGSSKPSHMYAEFMKKAALSYGIGTVAFFCISIMATGFPITLLLPMITACFPSTEIP